MLELSIIEGLTPENPTVAKKQFNDTGGIIGRDAQSDWSLFDLSRIVSGQHAKVIFSQGEYYLSDLSVNGISDVKGQRLSKGEYRLLHLNDIFTIGHYQIKVTRLKNIDEITAFEEAGLGHIINDFEQESALSPFEYVKKQNQAFQSNEPLRNPKHFSEKDTLKAFDFMPEPIDFRLKETPLPEHLLPDTQKSFIHDFCNLFGLDQKHFSGLDEVQFKAGLQACANAMAEKINVFGRDAS